MLIAGMTFTHRTAIALLMVLLIKREIRSHGRLWVACFSLLMVGLIAKITYETFTGLTIFVGNNHSGMVPVPLAHLVGGLVGTGIGLLKKSAFSIRPNPLRRNRHSFIPGDLMSPP